MKKSVLFSIVFIGLLVCSFYGVNAQGVGINSSGNQSDPSAMFDVSSTTKGTLLTRMSTAQRDAISSPALGLLILNTDCQNLNLFTTIGWQAITSSILPGPAGTITGSPTVCQSQNNISYSVSAITAATSYIWAYSGTGATISGSTSSITINFSASATSGNLTVTGNNPCGNGTISANYSITVNSVPASPTAATNTPSQTQIVWNWNTVSGATGYKWSTTNLYSSAADMLTVTSKTETGLTCNTAYTRYVWAYNSCGNSAPTTLTQTTSSCPFICGSTLTDNRDGKTYSTVLIGSQCWMKQNLNYGTMINSLSEQTNNGTAEKYCNSDDNNKCTTYGGLYQWGEAVQYLNNATNSASWSPIPSGNVQGLCPTGWHMPTDAEWCTLENAIEAGTDPGCNGIDWRGTNTGAKMKVTSGNTPPWDGTNTSGFSALPGGNREGGAVFLYFGTSGYFYSASEGSSTTAWWRNLTTGNSQSRRYAYDKSIGFSVRCLHD